MKEILNVYKIFAKKSPKESIGCFILNHLPSEGFIIPYMYHAYFIIKSDILVPDKILLTHHTQKPKVFFIQPLVLNQEIQDPKNTLKIVAIIIAVLIFIALFSMLGIFCAKSYKAKLISDKVTLKVTGAKSKVEKLSKNNIKIYVDLTNASVGTAKYELKIANQDGNIQYEFVNGQSVDIAISHTQEAE